MRKDMAELNARMDLFMSKEFTDRLAQKIDAVIGEYEAVQLGKPSDE